MTNQLISFNDLMTLINKHNSYNEDLKINGEFVKPSNIKAITNAFNSGYNTTITLKINGELRVLNGIEVLK